MIRKLSKGSKSFDDFCRRFHGGVNRGAEVKSYTLDEVVTTLNSVWPYEWAAFIHDRVYSVAPHAPTNGITAGGWRMGWADSLGPIQKSRETADKKLDESYSLGFDLKTETGEVNDIVPGAPADRAGIAPGMKLIAINGRRYSSDVLRDAIAATKQSGRIDLLCENKEFFQTYALEYREGRRHPVLVRDNGAGGIDIFTGGVENNRGVVRSFSYKTGTGFSVGSTRDLGYFYKGAINALAADGSSLYVGGEIGADRLTLSNTARGAVAGQEGFVARIDADLTSTNLDRATYLGSAQDDAVKSLAIVNGDVYAAGVTGGAIAGSGAAKSPLRTSSSFTCRRRDCRRNLRSRRAFAHCRPAPAMPSRNSLAGTATMPSLRSAASSIAVATGASRTFGWSPVASARDRCG